MPVSNRSVIVCLSIGYVGTLAPRLFIRGLLRRPALADRAHRSANIVESSNGRGSVAVDVFAATRPPVTT